MRFEEFKKELFKKRPDVRKEYESTQIAYDIAKKVMIARIDKGLSQTELARKIGTKQPSIARVESGVYSTNLDTLRKLSAVLGIEFTISELEDARKDFDFKLMYSEGEMISSLASRKQSSKNSSTKKEVTLNVK